MNRTDQSPPTFKPRKRPKNREVENEMVGWLGCDGEPPHSATEPITTDADREQAEELNKEDGAST